MPCVNASNSTEVQGQRAVKLVWEWRKVRTLLKSWNS
jgi:hypothetical protein